ncbi:hypothetical protein [Marinobacterium lutimaris]|uniref:Uncharacterized protein n=1 Tax=Marinobacterium lutimaris TaxID=568106 RepID=A0A1H5Y7C5_9GAMM|nr:hypothetical protein [Marinobacterium lutimaris]SEG19989.1 hypothetical protein SAMN05444390_1011649 [Marinobacterium lutimaris]
MKNIRFYLFLMAMPLITTAAIYWLSQTTRVDNGATFLLTSLPYFFFIYFYGLFDWSPFAWAERIREKHGKSACEFFKKAGFASIGVSAFLYLGSDQIFQSLGFTRVDVDRTSHTQTPYYYQRDPSEKAKAEQEEKERKMWEELNAALEKRFAEEDAEQAKESGLSEEQ